MDKGDNVRRFSFQGVWYMVFVRLNLIFLVDEKDSNARWDWKVIWSTIKIFVQMKYLRIVSWEAFVPNKPLVHLKSLQHISTNSNPSTQTPNRYWRSGHKVIKRIRNSRPGGVDGTPAFWNRLVSPLRVNNFLWRQPISCAYGLNRIPSAFAAADPAPPIIIPSFC